MKCPFKERKNFHGRVGLLEDFYGFFDPPTKSWHPKDLTNHSLTNLQISKEHQLTTMGIHVGIWILHLALLQKYRRNSMIAWLVDFQGFRGSSWRGSSGDDADDNGYICYIKFLKLLVTPNGMTFVGGRMCLVSEGCMTWADVDVQVFWSVSSIIIILLVLVVITHH